MRYVDSWILATRGRSVRRRCKKLFNPRLFDGVQSSQTDRYIFDDTVRAVVERDFGGAQTVVKNLFAGSLMHLKHRHLSQNGGHRSAGGSALRGCSTWPCSISLQLNAALPERSAGSESAASPQPAALRIPATSRAFLTRLPLDIFGGRPFKKASISGCLVGSNDSVRARANIGSVPTQR